MDNTLNDKAPPAPRLRDHELARMAQQLSGLSTHLFARRVLGRDERTERRWRNGHAIPAEARQFLERFVALDAERRRTLVAILVDAGDSHWNAESFVPTPTRDAILARIEKRPQEER